MTLLENFKLALAFYRGDSLGTVTGPTEVCPNCSGFGYRYDRGLWPWQSHCERCKGTGQAPIMAETEIGACAAPGGV